MRLVLVMTEFYRHLLHDSMSHPRHSGGYASGRVARRSADPALWLHSGSVVALGSLPTATPDSEGCNDTSLDARPIHGNAAVAHLQQPST